MARFARAVATILLLFTAAGASGCLNTWTGTYHEYPPSAFSDARTPQGDPEPNH